MVHNHHHHECKHYDVKYCTTCEVVYCSCGKEWGQKKTIQFPFQITPLFQGADVLNQKGHSH